MRVRRNSINSRQLGVLTYGYCKTRVSPYDGTDGGEGPGEEKERRGPCDVSRGVGSTGPTDLACVPGARPWSPPRYLSMSPASDRAPRVSIQQDLILDPRRRRGRRTEGMETELKLGPPGESPETEEKKTMKKVKTKKRDQLSLGRRDYKAVGWPPVCSYRQRTSSLKIYVKVSMDGAPFLRKLELTSCAGYYSLYSTVHALFDLGGLAAKEYSLIYEDDDGDWMLVGDVPWRMFTATCKRLRGMKKTT